MKNVVSLYPPQNSTIFKTGFCVAKKKVVFLGGGDTGSCVSYLSLKSLFCVHLQICILVCYSTLYFRGILGVSNWRNTVSHATT